MATSSRKQVTSVDSLSNLMETLVVSPISIGSALWVQVTHINNPNSFYVRQTSFNHYLPALQAPGSEVEVDQLQIGNVVVYKSKIHKCFIRGQIIFIDDINGDVNLEVFAMDYGNLERQIPLTSVCNPLNNNWIPPLVKHCSLVLCQPPNCENWPEKSIDAMKFYIGDERTKIIVKGLNDDLLTVIMYNSCPEDISTMLALQGYSVLSYDQQSVNRFSAKPAPKQAFYLFPTLKIGESLQVRVQSGRSLKEFYVAEVNSYQKYIREREIIAQFSRQEHAIRVEDMYEGKPVCVHTTTRYQFERAIIKKVNELKNKATVQLVDWGDTTEISLDNIKPIQESCLENEAIAIYCSTDESQVWDNGLQKFLYPGYSFIIKIKSLGDSFKTPNAVTIFKIPKTKSAC
ncbi:uncharacterized protein LOC128682934 [Plodia interpunctella]|uniref:uncharacterized protein LOC128682934 n=1 Tax=Plodia interpunctella TaxID=58824 RepID=UPI0023677826|nr:uncharacterized protein LOC128682934 [Plodia interpunctella]XP_053623974.1 uncharacterized protein LOC128682934 [Plodia interpunctella]XP_053623975.1 uncharacterized protein LOC128682934 [Plodia interpunctella]